MRYVSKIVSEWNGYREIFSRPQVTENSRQYLLLSAPVYSRSGGWAGSARGGGGGGVLVEVGSYHWGFRYCRNDHPQTSISNFYSF